MAVQRKAKVVTPISILDELEELETMTQEEAPQTIKRGRGRPRTVTPVEVAEPSPATSKIAQAKRSVTEGKVQAQERKEEPQKRIKRTTPTEKQIAESLEALISDQYPFSHTVRPLDILVLPSDHDPVDDLIKGRLRDGRFILPSAKDVATHTDRLMTLLAGRSAGDLDALPSTRYGGRTLTQDQQDVKDRYSGVGYPLTIFPLVRFIHANKDGSVSRMARTGKIVECYATYSTFVNRKAIRDSDHAAYVRFSFLTDSETSKDGYIRSATLLNTQYGNTLDLLASMADMSGVMAWIGSLAASLAPFCRMSGESLSTYLARISDLGEYKPVSYTGKARIADTDVKQEDRAIKREGFRAPII